MITNDELQPLHNTLVKNEDQKPMTQLEETHLKRNALDVVAYGRKYFPNALVWTGLDNAIVGFGWVKRGDMMGQVAIYDYELTVKSLCENGMNVDDADEYIQYNIIGAYIGPNTPIMRMTACGDSCV